MKLLSIIIPTLNEAKYLSRTIMAVQSQRTSNVPVEIILVDAGSTDGTTSLVINNKLHVTQFKLPASGRAETLNFGAQNANGDVLLFLDADSILPQGYDNLIKTALGNDDVIGGAFEFALEGKEFGLRFVEWMNRLRYRIWPLYYGDQGIFVRKNIFDEVDGFPIRPILEASHFCKKAIKWGKLQLIPRKIYSSPRRFIEGGIYRIFFVAFKIWWLDMIGFSTDHFAQEYWENNKLRGSNVKNRSTP